MFQITVETRFNASHALRLPDGSLEPVHGHDWQVRATIQSPQLDAMETMMDFHLLEQLLREIVKPWHHGCLNDLPPFANEQGQLTINPSAERVAEQIGRNLQDKLPTPATIHHITISEAPGCWATWLP